MARTKRFLHGLSSSYLLILVNTVWTLASLPLGLHFLSRDEYTLWLVASQVAGYLSMIDLGTTGAGIRLLVDQKDAPEKGDYGSLIKSMCFIQFVQAGLILAVGLGIAGVVPGLLKNVPMELVASFRMLWFWQVNFLALNFALRIGNQILLAHQRFDISNYAQIGAVVLNLALLLGGLWLGWGLYSFVVAQGISLLLMLFSMLAACIWLRLLPAREGWGKLSRHHLRGLWGLGVEFFLISLGNLLITGSQTFLLTRLQNWNAALVWSVMTKLFSLATQVTSKIITTATPAFSEMIVRNERDQLQRRYRSVFELSVLASCYFGVLIGFGNSAFVDVWTNGRVQWNPINDWLLAVWFLLCTASASHNTLIVSTKRVQATKFVYLFEGTAFIAASLLLIPRGGGISAMLVSSIVCTLLFTFTYGTWRVASLAKCSFRDLAFRWFGPAGRFLMFTLPIGLCLAFLTRDSSRARALGCGVSLAVVGALFAARFCVPRDVSREIVKYLPKPLRSIGGALDRT